MKFKIGDVVGYRGESGVEKRGVIIRIDYNDHYFGRSIDKLWSLWGRDAGETWMPSDEVYPIRTRSCPMEPRP